MSNALVIVWLIGMTVQAFAGLLLVVANVDRGMSRTARRWMLVGAGMMLTCWAWPIPAVVFSAKGLRFLSLAAAEELREIRKDREKAAAKAAMSTGPQDAVACPHDNFVADPNGGECLDCGEQW